MYNANIKQKVSALFDQPCALLQYYHQVRKQSEQICAPLETEDYVVQVASFATPPKWHLAHTAWFFETMLLIPFAKDYQPFHPLYGELFNSYYDTIGDYHPRPERGLLSRPTVKDVYHYRAYIDEHMEQLLTTHDHPSSEEIAERTLLGLNHEQQHQELLLTDIKYNFAYSPLKPVYSTLPTSTKQSAEALCWITFEGGLKQIGFEGQGFAYDNEMPRHKVYLDSFKLASRPVTNAEYILFIEDGGYQEPDLWLSDAWKILQQQKWQAPLYWEKQAGNWSTMTLAGMRSVDLQAPVTHVSFYEASAYARWAGKRLPSEAEWEIASKDLPIKGNFVESGLLQPAATTQTTALKQMFGDVWEWTQSAYMPFPGYHQKKGPLGEYNGKFMSSQMVLRGGSCATSESHIRSTYRNFFYPQERWQFSGIRLAKDLS